MKFISTTVAAILLFCAGAFADSQDRHLTGFNAIEVAGSYDVYLTQGNTESVRVEAPGDVIDKILTEVRGNTLRIYNRNEHGSWNWGGDNNKKMAVYVTVKDINSIGITGSGDVYFKSGINAPTLRVRVTGSGDMQGRLNVKTLELSITGSGDVKLNGRAETSTVSVSGSGDFSGRDLATVRTSVRVTGSGDASVNASDTIDAGVSGSGDISYSGSASHVSTSTRGSGEIHRN